MKAGNIVSLPQIEGGCKKTPLKENRLDREV